MTEQQKFQRIVPSKPNDSIVNISVCCQTPRNIPLTAAITTSFGSQNKIEDENEQQARPENKQHPKQEKKNVKHIESMDQVYMEKNSHRFRQIVPLKSAHIGIAWIFSIIISIMTYHYLYFYELETNANSNLDGTTVEEFWPRNLMRACDFKICELVIVKYNRDFISISPGGTSLRNYNVIRMLYEAYSLIQSQIKPGDHIVGFSITDSEYTVTNGAPPPGIKLYESAATRDNLKNAVPDFSFYSWTEAKIYFSEETINELRENCKKPFAVDKLFWRGASGKPARNTLVSLARSHPDLIAADFIKWIGENPDGGAPFVKLQDHYQYSMLIDIEGNGYSARLKYLAHANRTLFIQDRKYWDWSVAGLEPYKHYIPVKNDLSDLVNQIKWAKEHPKDILEMNNRRIEYADKNMRYKNALDRFGQILIEN